jgi:hypothetical protein
MKALLLVALLVPFSRAVAQEETQAEKRLPEELAISRSIVIQDADELETTAGFNFFKFHDQKQITAAAEFEYGLTERWELDAEVPYRFVNPNGERAANGIGDVETGVRYNVIPLGKEPLALNVGFTVGIPTGDRLHDLGEGRLTLAPSFTASTWAGPVNVQLNCAWERAVTDAGEEPRDSFVYNVAVLYPIQHWFLGLEGNGTSTHDATEYYVTPELIWKPKSRLQFLVAAPIGVTGASADYGIVASVTLELENITHRGVDKD